MNEQGYDPIGSLKRGEVAREGRVFPPTEILSNEQGAEVRQWLMQTTGLSANAENWDINHALYARVVRVPEFDGVIDDLVEPDYAQLMLLAGISSDKVLVLLPLEGAFDSVVRMDRMDLVAFFDDIWIFDDIIVIDEQAQRLLLLNHHSLVGAMSLGPRP